MNDLRQAAEQALEALRYTTDHLPAKTGVERYVDEAITALQLALVKPERSGLTEWVGLTDDEIIDVLFSLFMADMPGEATDYEIARAIEAKLKDKNT